MNDLNLEVVSVETLKLEQEKKALKALIDRGLNRRLVGVFGDCTVDMFGADGDVPLFTKMKG